MSDEPDMTCYYSAGWMVDGDGLPNPHLPGGDVMDSALNVAISEYRVAEREREQWEAEEQSHYEDLERMGQSKTLREVFDRIEVESHKTDVRAAANEKRLAAAADAPETTEEYLDRLRVKARESRRVLDAANVHFEYREDGTRVTVPGATDAGNLEWAQKQRENRRRRQQLRGRQ